jgi:hypothetical protein
MACDPPKMGIFNHHPGKIRSCLLGQLVNVLLCLIPKGDFEIATDATDDITPRSDQQTHQLCGEV